MRKRAKFKGLRIELDKTLITSTVKACGQKAIKESLEYIAEISKEQVPVDTGALRDSCEVTLDDSRLAGVVSYNTDYAVDQHENLTYGHHNGGNAKFLENPVNDSVSTGQQITTNAFREKMG